MHQPLSDDPPRVTDEPRTVIEVLGRVLLDERAAEPERLALRGVLLLAMLAWLHRDHAIARLAHFSGAVIMLFACAWALTLVVRHWQRLGSGDVDVDVAAPDER